MPSRPPVLRPVGWRPPAERRAEADQARGSAHQRGYTAEWRRARAAFLARQENATCAEPGCGARSTVVDHITPHRGDRTLFWDRHNWRGMCKSHHDSKTARLDHVGRRRSL